MHARWADLIAQQVRNITYIKFYTTASFKTLKSNVSLSI